MKVIKYVLVYQFSISAPVNQHQQLLPVHLVSTAQVDMIVPVMRLMTVLLHTSVEVSQSVSSLTIGKVVV